VGGGGTQHDSIPISVKRDLLYLRRYYNLGPSLEKAGWRDPDSEEEGGNPGQTGRRRPSTPGLLEKLGLLGGYPPCLLSSTTHQSS
jgi:hypothetical protein